MAQKRVVEEPARNPGSGVPEVSRGMEQAFAETHVIHFLRLNSETTFLDDHCGFAGRDGAKIFAHLDHPAMCKACLNRRNILQEESKKHAESASRGKGMRSPAPPPVFQAVMVPR